MKLILARRRASNAEFIEIFKETKGYADYLDAAYNKLDENMTIDFDLIKSFTKLRLSHNTLEAFPEFIIDLNIDVSILDLSYNTICEVSSIKRWENASMLTKLCLQGNRLTSIPDCLEMFTSLKVLLLGDDLSGNSLTELPESIKCLASLEELSVARNRLKSFPMQVLSLPRLTQLNLARNCIQKFPEGQYRLRVEHINLSCNCISELPRRLHLSPLVKSIDLTGNPLKYIPADLPLDKFTLSCNDCFFQKQTSIELVQEFKKPQLKYLALDQVSKQGNIASHCPLTLQSCLEKIPSTCASCPFRFMHPYGEVMMPGVVQGHHQVPVLSEVCSQSCATGLTIKLSTDHTLCIDSDDLNDF